jgi:peptide/nickel transport system permease protein
MTAYIIRRLFQCAILIILVSMIVFLLIRLMPGDPLQMVLSLEDIATMTGGYQDAIEALRVEYGLDRPLAVQYFSWLWDVVRGNFGRSIVRGFDIASELARRMQVTLFLGIVAFIVSNIFGLLFGTITAIRRGKVIDTVVTSIANIGVTAPSFLIAILVIYIFGFRMQVLPIFGYQLPWAGDYARSLRQMVLPVFVMSLGPMASICRQTRSSVLEELNKDHVRTAWAKGMREKTVIFRHVLKNAMMPIVSLQGGMLRGIFGGSAIVEQIFVIPGAGQLMVSSMLASDYTVIQAVTIMLTFVAVMSNLIVDLLYGWVDPRIQYS